jgi:hypothetical protein
LSDWLRNEAQWTMTRWELISTGVTGSNRWPVPKSRWATPQARAGTGPLWLTFVVWGFSRVLIISLSSFSGSEKLLDTTLIDMMWAKKASWTQLETEQEEWHTHTHTHKPRHTHTYHWGLYTYMTSYLAKAYRLSINIDKSTLLSIVNIDKPTLLSIEKACIFPYESVS